MFWSKPAAVGLMALLLAGCSTPPARVLRDLPPQDLLQDCEEPTSPLQTNRHLAEHILALRTALRLCNNDKAALREWAKE